MKKTKKIFVFLVALLSFLGVGCATSFCSEEDIKAIQSSMLEQCNSTSFDANNIYSQPDAARLESVAGITAKSILENKACTTFSGDANTVLTWDMLEGLVYSTSFDSATGVQITVTYKEFYVQSLYNNYHPKACLTTEEHTDKFTGAKISAKTFEYAFKKGLLEMLAFPFSFLIVAIGNLLGSTGVSYMFGVVVVTFFIRFLALLLTFKQTKQTTKMQELQPQLNAIQAKYAGKTDQQSKMAMSQETMNLYSKNGINPASSLLTPFITLPIFIAIYSAVKDTTVLFECDILGLSLGAKLGQMILSWNWVAIMIFILMIGSQLVTMNLQKWINNARNKKSKRRLPKGSDKNPTQNFMTIFMLVMIVFIAWSLPVAMSIYWIASSVFSILQTVILPLIGKKEK